MLRPAFSIICAVASIWSMQSYAQLAGYNTRGDYGLQSGTQPPSGHYAVGMLYNYSADTLRDRNGDSLPARTGGGSVDANATVFGYLAVTEKKLLGGNYGFAIYPALTNNAVELPALQTDTEVSTGLADLYIQPLILGWTQDSADFTAGLGIYAPTGRYEAGADDNRGLGMWSYEVFGGATYYFDERRSWHLAATAFYETHGEKEDSDVTVGDILTIEGGFGKSFMEGAANIGVAYYGQWKLTRDDFGVQPPNGPRIGKHEVFAAGPEVTLPLASKSKLYGFVNLRYFWEFDAKSALEGDTFLLTLTFPMPSIPLN